MVPLKLVLVALPVGVAALLGVQIGKLVTPRVYATSSYAQIWNGRPVCLDGWWPPPPPARDPRTLARYLRHVRDPLFADQVMERLVSNGEMGLDGAVLNVREVPNSRFVGFEAIHRNPRVARNIANAAVSAAQSLDTEGRGLNIFAAADTPTEPYVSTTGIAVSATIGSTIFIGGALLARHLRSS
jgi:hypothetical protein